MRESMKSTSADQHGLFTTYIYGTFGKDVFPTRSENQLLGDGLGVSFLDHGWERKKAARHRTQLIVSSLTISLKAFVSNGLYYCKKYRTCSMSFHQAKQAV